MIQSFFFFAARATRCLQGFARYLTTNHSIAALYKILSPSPSLSMRLADFFRMKWISRGQQKQQKQSFELKEKKLPVPVHRKWQKLVSVSKNTLAMAAMAFVAGCSLFHKPPNQLPEDNLHPLNRAQSQAILNQYKVMLAHRISLVNFGETSFGRPQSMLRSVVVIAFKVDKQGQLLGASVYRTNGDAMAEHIALNSLQHASPLPPPPAPLVSHNGSIEITEGWLFNNDGRFQLRSIALPQMAVVR